MTTVPDFFQDDSPEALRLQVQWQGQHLGLGTRFFARFLRQDDGRFSSWLKTDGVLTSAQEDALRTWWQTILHLLSFQNFNEKEVRALLERTAAPGVQRVPSVFSPPWSASSLKAYLETDGPEAIPAVNRWLESFRFGEPYGPPAQGRTCLSTHA